jgi:hypothetical protein
MGFDWCDIEEKLAYKQLQTGVREKEKEETKGESVTKSRR